MSDTLINDTEAFPNFWCAGFMRPADGKILVLRKSDDPLDRPLDRDRLRRLMLRNEIITFNGMGYDRAMIWGAIEGLSCAQLKELNDCIIIGGVRWWELDDLMRTFIPEWDGFPHMNLVDLMEPQPNPFAGLKLLNGRLHGQKMQDLPYTPDQVLTPHQIENVVTYLGNDLRATKLLWESLAEPLALREALSKEFRSDFRSKSDSQMGEFIVKRRFEQITNTKIKRTKATHGAVFKYEVPDFIKFETPMLQELLAKIAETEFKVKPTFKVDLPDFLKNEKIRIGQSAYQMGIGGLHSTEANRSIFADAAHYLIDADVASQYPSIILKLGLYPAALGPAALTAYAAIKEERLIAKRAKDKVKDQGYKIALNGGFFGKTGSPYSVLFAPHLMIAVTLTGQLTLLMLIERAEAIGVPIVSGNTDGVLFHCPVEKYDALMEICKQWEAETSFELEFASYRSIHNRSVNDYIAVKEDGSLKRKGKLMNTRKEGMREQLMHNPGMDICADAVCEFLLTGAPIEETIRNATDFRDFLTVVNVKGGAIWGDMEIPSKKKNEEQDDYTARFGLNDFEYLGKVVRYYWGVGGAPIYYKDPHPSTGNFKKVSKSDGAIPCMDLPEGMATNIDYARYIREAEEILVDLGLRHKPVDRVHLSFMDSFNILLTL